ncbi:hypothetical protein GCM10025859_56330 [Alicyclobacillus fastidiosus]|nr:hypothetical protein GCM10025859_56330 [Alicyclobacillus fastidiosus]
MSTEVKVDAVPLATKDSRVRWIYVAPTLLVIWVVSLLEKIGVGIIATNKHFFGGYASDGSLGTRRRLGYDAAVFIRNWFLCLGSNRGSDWAKEVWDYCTRGVGDKHRYSRRIAQRIYPHPIKSFARFVGGGVLASIQLAHGEVVSV